MPDLTMVPEPADDDQLAGLRDRIKGGFGHWPNLYASLANAPDLLAAWIDFAWTLRAVPEMPRSLRELAIMRVAQLTGSEYEWRAHWPMAIEAGVPTATLEGLARWRDLDGLTAGERLVLSVTEQLTNDGELDVDARSELVGTFGERQTVELVLTIAFYSCVRRVLGGLGVPLDARHAESPGLQAG